MIHRVMVVGVICACLGMTALGVPIEASAQTQAVECPKLKGATMEYGVPAKVRFDRIFQPNKHNTGTPKKYQYVPPYADGFASGVNFLVHAKKGTVTVLWQLMPALKAANQRATPGEPRDYAPAPVTAKIVSYMPHEMLTAVATGRGVDGESVTTYTFFPELRSVFVTQTTYVHGETPDAMVITAQGACDFSYNG